METEEEEKEYFEFLARGMVLPSKMEITVLDRDGSNFRQVTDNGKANFAPYWHPDDKRIVFASNMDSESGRDFQIYMINEDSTGQVQVTHNETFDSFPMFSPDGRHLVFASNRYGSVPTSGCSGPRAFSSIASARLKSGSAWAYLPWAW